ncbi:MAG: peptidoglycan editing factor PgeF [Vicinamibacterales bacterium]
MLTCDALATVVRHGFTTRQLQLQPGERAGRAWAAVAASVGCEPGQIERVRQVHGAQVRVVSGPALEGAVPEADAAITRAPGTAVAVVAADCVPVLLADQTTGAVAAVHAGWRGTAADVVGAAVGALQREYGADPASMQAAVGPAIGPCCYAVGPELVTAFRQAGHSDERLDRWFTRTAGRLTLDLWKATRDLLEASGIPPANVHVARLCTKTHRAVFESFRADGDKAGRMAAIVVAPARRPSAAAP